MIRSPPSVWTLQFSLSSQRSALSGRLWSVAQMGASKLNSTQKNTFCLRKQTHCVGEFHWNSDECGCGQLVHPGPQAVEGLRAQFRVKHTHIPTSKIRSAHNICYYHWNQVNIGIVKKTLAVKKHWDIDNKRSCRRAAKPTKASAASDIVKNTSTGEAGPLRLATMSIWGDSATHD